MSWSYGGCYYSATSPHEVTTGIWASLVAKKTRREDVGLLSMKCVFPLHHHCGLTGSLRKAEGSP